MVEEYWHFIWGGFSIAGVSVCLVLFGGKFISVTRGYVSACSIFTKKEYFNRPEMGGKFGFRTMFVAGLILGGLLAALTTTGYNPGFDLGSFDKIWGDELYIKIIVLGLGGFLWGYGSRLAGGCTSGNSIAGLSKGSVASLMATMGFLAAGAGITFLVNFIAGQL